LLRTRCLLAFRLGAECRGFARLALASLRDALLRLPLLLFGFLRFRFPLAAVGLLGFRLLLVAFLLLARRLLAFLALVFIAASLLGDLRGACIGLLDLGARAWATPSWEAVQGRVWARDSAAASVPALAGPAAPVRAPPSAEAPAVAPPWFRSPLL
jgi:hypothetical protein